MKQLTIIVRRVLESNAKARGDDYVLIGEVLSLYVPRSCDVSLSYIIAHHKDLKMPSFESITRARRKLQEQFPELKANVEPRKKREKEMMEYSHASKYQIDSFDRA